MPELDFDPDKANKFIMTVKDKVLQTLFPPKEPLQSPEAGMGYLICRIKNDRQRQPAFYAILLNGAVLPFSIEADPTYYNLKDLFNAESLPSVPKENPGLKFNRKMLVDRAQGADEFLRLLAQHTKSATTTATIHPGAITSVPLIYPSKLKAGTILHRFVSHPTDRGRANFGGVTTMAAGSYFCGLKEPSHVDTGLLAVGRFALPIPLPATHMFQYELQQDANVLAGTVEPLFGQSGGGVEICLSHNTDVKTVGHAIIPPF